MTHVACRLSAMNPDQLQNPTLGNRVWATFTLVFHDELSPDTPLTFYQFPDISRESGHSER